MSTTSPARVVVADDSALMRNIVARSLSKAGIEVVGSARDGDEALALCPVTWPGASCTACGFRWPSPHRYGYG